MSGRTSSTAPILSAARLAIGYARHPVVSDIAFDLSGGATLALVGVNGSGKSTLLKTIAGLLPSVDGTLAVFGEQPGRAPARVAYLSQFHAHDTMLPLRVVDIVRMARFASLGLLGRAGSDDERLVRRSLERMGVADLAAAPLSSLSGGQRQRVFIAQALARNADLLLMDEPETNLDAEGKQRYREAVQDITGRGGAVVIATHDIKEATRCDWAMLLAQRVVAYGPGCSVLTPDALLSTFGITARMEEGRVVVVEREHGHECGE
jgi:ABC-type Mn2+/Zn2+ transport system ATPase subunit